MTPWLEGFIVGVIVGAFVAVVVSLFLLRRWMVSASVQSSMCEALIARLAKADKQKSLYKEELERVASSHDELMDEKLRKWDIPGEI